MDNTKKSKQQQAKNPYYRLSLTNITHNKDLIDEYAATLPILDQLKTIVMLYEVFDIMDQDQIQYDTEHVTSVARTFGLWLLEH